MDISLTVKIQRLESSVDISLTVKIQRLESSVDISLTVTGQEKHSFLVRSFAELRLPRVIFMCKNPLLFIPQVDSFREEYASPSV